MEGMRTLERALDILECFTTGSNHKQGLADLVKETELPKATVHRMVKNLERRGYLAYDKESETYRLGYRVLLLSTAYLHNLEIRSVALPYMKELRDRTSESVSLWIEKNDLRVCVERVQSREPLRQVLYVGDTFPLGKGASGKLLLAYHNNPVDDAKLPPNEAESIRSRGFSFSNSERSRGISAVAAPIFSSSGSVIACLSLSGPSSRFDSNNDSVFSEIVIKSAQYISRDLGFVKKD